MDQKEMLEICFDDRYRALCARGISFVKKSNLDLLMKFFILMRNSIGKPSAVQSIFVDEVKNSSMIINLRNTMAHCPADSAVINFREKERAHRHVKIGWLQPVALSLPAAHVFEGMRAALLEGRVAWDHLGAAFALDAFWLAAMAWVFMRQFQAARVKGALLNIGE